MKQLLRENVPKAQIARQLGISRQTIYNWIEEPDDKICPARRPSKLDPFHLYIRGRLERFDLPATDLRTTQEETAAIRSTNPGGCR